MNPGETSAHYKVGEKIGGGGMGEVFRATDTKLGREVTLKVLPADLSADPDRLTRFRNEVRTLASLQHPNVASINGVEEVDNHPLGRVTARTSDSPSARPGLMPGTRFPPKAAVRRRHPHRTDFRDGRGAGGRGFRFRPTEKPA